MLNQLLLDNAELKKKLEAKEAKEGTATPSSTRVPSKHAAAERGGDFDPDELEQAMEASRASAGLSSSSRAGSIASGASGRKHADIDGEPVEDDEQDEEAEEAEEAEEPSKDHDSKLDDGPTSTTHRKEYMALCRKMETADPAKFPEVSALWNASRAVSLIADRERERERETERERERECVCVCA